MRNRKKILNFGNIDNAWYGTTYISLSPHYGELMTPEEIQETNDNKNPLIMPQLKIKL